ncbi:MAG: hypothetical protein DMG78_16205 [Acidobacteria bacterium]|nr:MAG: hypothetical protein DMG78_16205 [Acidobacteriota bacterium]
MPLRETHAPPAWIIAFFSTGGIWRNTCNGQVMILLITPQSKGPEFAAALLAATSQETHWAQNLQEAATRLREQTYSAAIIDQFLLETEPEESDQVLEHLGTAFPVYVNFALTGMDRLLREVRSALHRRKREEATARRAVAEQMQSEMRETLTVMLLSCELAMAIPNVPSPAAEKIRTIDTLARELRLRLEVN